MSCFCLCSERQRFYFWISFEWADKRPFEIEMTKDMGMNSWKAVRAVYRFWGRGVFQAQQSEDLSQRSGVDLTKGLLDTSISSAVYKDYEKTVESSKS